MKKYFVISIPVLLLLSCTAKIEEEKPANIDNGSRITSFYATLEGNETLTKVYADENMKVLWNADDRLSIFNKSTFNYQFRFTGEDGDNAGGFDEIAPSGFISGNSLDNIYAVYPYSSSNKINNSGTIVTLSLPAEQQYKEHSFGVGANTMIAVTNNNYLAFKNVGGYLGIRLYGNNISVSRVSITGNNHEKIAGKANISVGLDTMPSVNMTEDATETISVICEPAVALGTSKENYTEFWFVIPPITFTNGFTITVTDAFGGVFKKSTSKSVTISRSTKDWMSALKMEPNVFTINPVDMGLSVMWGDRNLGAMNTLEMGDYYAWGETQTHYQSLEPLVWKDGLTGYSWNTYGFCTVSGEDVSISKYKTLKIDGILELEDDAANQLLGGGWRMPTKAEAEELIENCLWTSENIDGVSYIRITSKITGESFLQRVQGLTAIGKGDEWEGLMFTYNQPKFWVSNITYGAKIADHIDISTSPYVGYDYRFQGHLFHPVFDKSLYIDFTDANFKAYCVENFDTDGDGEISRGEAKKVSVIDVCTDNISSLGGIEFFTNLTSLSARGSGAKCRSSDGSFSRGVLNSNSLPYPTPGTSVAQGQLTGIDLSGLNKLRTINISMNNTVTDFVPGNCLSLEEISCSFCNMTELDISNNAALISLDCSANPSLTTLDVSKNTALTKLLCECNNLSALDISKNTALTELDCGYNELSALDISNTALTVLDCSGNELSVLDISKNTALTELDCGGNELPSLDVSKHTALTKLCCDNNNLSTLDVSKNTALTGLSCDNNNLSTLDISKNIALEELYCDNTELTTLDVSENTNLMYLRCAGNKLTTLNVSENTKLWTLYCHGNQLVSLDVSKNTNLRNLLCKNNPNLEELWLKTGQVIPNLYYDSDITTIKYKD